MMKYKSICWIISIVLLTAGPVSLLRWFGWLELYELLTFDRFVLAVRPPASERVAVVGFTDEDIERYGWPISDEILADVISEISEQKPVAIGLDVFRDLPEVFEKTPELIGIKLLSRKLPGAPVPARFGASDVVGDLDTKIRRGLIFVHGKPSLSAALALQYLQAREIVPLAAPDENMRLGEAVFDILTPRFGPYPGTVGGDVKIVLSFTPYERESSFTDVLDGNIAPDEFTGRVVLIGSVATGAGDEFSTPLSKGQSSPERMHGVQLFAHFAAELIESALGNQPTIKSWSEPIEIAYILLWTAASVGPIWLLRRRRLFVGYGVAIAVGLSGAGVAIAYGAFASNGLWLPVVPVVLVVVVGAVTAMLAANNLQLREEIERQKTIQTSLTHDVRVLNANILKLSKTPQLAIEFLDSINKNAALVEYLCYSSLAPYKNLKIVKASPNEMLRFASELNQYQHRDIEVREDCALELEEKLPIQEGINVAFYNLANNAFRAVQNKDYSEGETPSVCFSSRFHDGWIELSVRDNGTGIPKELLKGDRIFRAYTKGSDSEGLGMGTYNAKAIVERCGGEIRFQSDSSTYTEATIRIPKPQQLES